MIASVTRADIETAVIVQLGGIIVAAIAAYAAVKAARTARENNKQLMPTNGDDRPTRELIEVMETTLETMSTAVRGNSRRLDQQGREIGALEAGQTVQNETLDLLRDAIENHQVFCQHNIDLFHGVMPGGQRRTDPPKRKEPTDGLE